MTHQSLNGLEVVPVVQEGRGESMPHNVRMNPLLGQCLFYQGFDQVVNGLRGQGPFLVGTMLPQALEEGMIWIGLVPGGLQVILYGDQGFTVRGILLNLFPLPMTSTTARLR